MRLKLLRRAFTNDDYADAVRRMEDWAAQVSVPPEVTTTFAVKNLAASLAAVQLRNGAMFPASGGLGDMVGRQVGLTMPWNGAIVAISLVASTAKTAGVGSFEVWVDGVASGAILTWANNDHDYVNFAREDFEFVEGQVLDIRATTDGAFAPVTSEVAVTMFCLREP